MAIPYIPIYVTDYEADTAHLSLEEDGAYMRLLRLCWRTPGCSIPDDPEWIMRRLRVDAETYARSVAPVVEEYFIRAKGRLFQPRLQREHERINDTHKKRVEAGKRGGRPAKALKKAENSESRAKAGPKPTESNYNQNYNQNQTPSNEGNTRKRATRLPEDWTPPEEWIDEAVSRGFTRAEAYDHAEQMRDWSRSAKAGAKLDWRAAWRNWVKRKLQEREARPADRQQSNTERRRSAWLDVVDEIEREGAGRNTLELGGARSVAYLPRACSGDA